MYKYNDGQKLRFTESFNMFRLLKGFTTILEWSNELKLYSVEVFFYQTCKFVILGENIRKKRKKLSFLKRSFLPYIFFYGIKFACLIKANRIKF